MSWIERVEAILDILKGSSICEIELLEGEQEITIRRNPGTIVATSTHPGLHLVPSPETASRTLIDMKSPLTGVYYAASTPEAAPFVNIGDFIQVGQTIALIETMKVFSEVTS